MRLQLPARPVPGVRLIAGVLGLALACVPLLLAGLAPRQVALLAGGAAALALLLAAVDLGRGLWALRRHPLQLQRRVPRVLALEVNQRVELQIDNQGQRAWSGWLFDGIAPSFDCTGLPLQVHLPAAGRVQAHYELRPTLRGAAEFGPARLRLATPWGLWALQLRLGPAQPVRVFPNFAAVAGYAWLAGQQRLSEIGIKTRALHGLGTDFHSLADYQEGDVVRDVDWKASLRRGHPVVRRYQDERDQRVVCLLDCGRRMRADEGSAGAGGSHFDHALNALMLLAYVALKAGDEVGVRTFGHPAGQGRQLRPRKGLQALDGIMSALHDLQPGTDHSDHLAAARDLMQHEHRRSLVIVITNCRDDDLPELLPALRLLRSRHLVLLASLRERVLSTLVETPLATAGQAAVVAAAHLFNQSRADAMRRLAAQHTLLVDVEPGELAAALVRRYQAVKATHRL
jgi:uncharacterized protein (DUF58 family)